MLVVAWLVERLAARGLLPKRSSDARRQVQQAAVRNSSDSTDSGSLRPFGGWRSESKIVNATGLSGAFFESSEALCGLGEGSP